MPHSEGRVEPFANSPKSLSNVSRMRCSRAAHARTSTSVAPGAALLTQTMSCPATSRAATAAPGKFSSARKRISSCARKYPFGTQSVARIRQASDDIIMGQARITLQNIGLGPAVRHQTDYELHGEPCSTNDRLADEHLSVEHDAWMICHDGLVPYATEDHTSRGCQRHSSESRRPISALIAPAPPQPASPRCSPPSAPWCVRARPSLHPSTPPAGP
jgi:hypothetical protein